MPLLVFSLWRRAHCLAEVLLVETRGNWQLADLSGRLRNVSVEALCADDGFLGFKKLNLRNLNSEHRRCSRAYEFVRRRVEKALSYRFENIGGRGKPRWFVPFPSGLRYKAVFAWLPARENALARWLPRQQDSSVSRSARAFRRSLRSNHPLSFRLVFEAILLPMHSWPTAFDSFM